MPTSTGARKPRPKKTFKLYELVEGVHLKYLMDYDGATGPVAHKKAVEDGHVAPETLVVTLSPRNLTAGSFEETAPARPVLKFKSVGKPKGTRAAKPAASTAAPKAAPTKPATTRKPAGTKAATTKKASGTKAGTKAAPKKTTAASTKKATGTKANTKATKATPATPPPPPPPPAPAAGSNPFAE